ncbi:hypothetical protein AK88_00723 [Plasmodium fragile]|uniref:Glutaredoxin domain-containing protein n=1 Tax=Plasmodium fragile TaxID=5857 RepID=A0A0D9QRT3_PLAFR|nr:uncharacterized protein AK88_00723 [Plasmodium fragile]KJP89512.1 hypothetical protein AK88_00723 [Plasmodium fragile]
METENVETAPETVENDNTQLQSEGQDGISIMQEAEIVLITTSLGGIKSSFFSSLRAQNLLNCKKFLYVVIDSNRDTSTAKNLKDEELFNQWKEDELLQSNENGVVLPQVLIDGVSVGNDIALQNLEDEGNLDFIVSRLKCPNCLQEKSNTDVQCPHCKYDYVSLISDDLIRDNAVVRMLQGELYNEDETAE